MRRVVNFVVLFFLFSFSNSPTLAQAPSGELSGTVIDRGTHQPVPGATIKLLGTALGGISKPSGEFLIKNIPPETYRVNVSSVGYEIKIIEDVSVRSGHTSSLTVELVAKDVQLESASVTAPLFEKNSDNITSTHSFNYEEVRRAPGAVEDVSRIAQSMPGVSFTNDGRNDLVVRGGSPTENLTVVDGIDIPNINHFGTQGAAGGPIGMLDVNFIDKVDFSSGGFQAEYGDKLSSVMTIGLREGNRSGFQGNANLSSAGIGVVLEGPIASSGSYMFSVRRSYLNLIHNVIGLTAVPNYQDIQTKITCDLSPSNKISFLFIGGLDEIHFDANASDSTGLQFQNTQLTQWQATAALSWRWLWGTSGYSDVSLFSNFMDYNINANDNANNPEFTDQSHDREYGLRAKAAWQINHALNLTSGATVTMIGFHDAIFQKRDSIEYRDSTGAYLFSPYGGIDANAKETTMKLAAFSELSATLGNIVLTGGLRFDHFAYLTGTNSVLGPRLGASYLLSPVTSINASYGIFYQAPELVWLTTVDANRGLLYMRAQHAIIGFEHQFDEDLKFTVEAYDKEYNNYPVSVNNPYFVLVNSGADYGADIPGPANSSGTGFVRGVDIFLQKKLIGNLYGLISYSLSESRFQGDAGGLRPGSFDYPQMFTLIAGYTIGNDWEFSLKFRYATGRPYTPYDLAQSMLINQGVPEESQYNQSRLPDYSRLDVRADKRAQFSWGNLVAYVELQNVYARNNIQQYYWNTTTNAIGKIYQWGFVPIGGVKVEF